MGDTPKSSGGFSFGTPATSVGSSLFSPSNATGSSLFAPKSTAQGNLFGTTPSSSGTSLFGSAPATSGANPPTFSLLGGASTGNKPPTGGTNNNTSNIFSTFSTPSKPADSNAGQPSQSINMFGGGSTTASSNIFGNAGTSALSSAVGASTPAPSKPGSGFSFSNLSTTPAGPPPAGGKGSGAPTASLFDTNKIQQASGLFGGMNTGLMQSPASTVPANPFSGTAQSSTSNLFGSTKPADLNTANSKPQSSSALFGSASTAPKSSLFGNTGTSGNIGTSGSSGSSPFSGFASAESSQQASGDASKKSTTSLFQNMQSPDLTSQKPLSITSSQPAGQPLFGNPGTNSAATAGSATPASSLASTQPPATTVAGVNSMGISNPFGNAQGQATPSTTNAINPGSGATASPFSNLGSQIGASSTAATSSSQPSLFSGLGGTSMGRPAENPQSQASVTSSSSATTTAPASAPSLFNTSNTPATTTTTQPAMNARPEAAKSTNLGASTSGPRPTSQSRLKNKSMDEIITRWASDLSKYQKEFSKQAEKVAEWDRVLVDNSDKITKLYGSTLEAERATVEVERQLSSVENDQAELQYWLDHYEKQVDELMSNQIGQGDSLQGPDQERERTHVFIQLGLIHYLMIHSYKLAEKLSDRLDEMGKDLTSMIEEINDASSSLNKNSKSDDPLSQIVCVLNGHLHQLQQIDAGTAALQAQVAAAQKASRNLNYTNRSNGLGNDAADDFYRSYMGRR